MLALSILSLSGVRLRQKTPSAPPFQAARGRRISSMSSGFVIDRLLISSRERLIGSSKPLGERIEGTEVGLPLRPDGISKKVKIRNLKESGQKVEQGAEKNSIHLKLDIIELTDSNKTVGGKRRVSPGGEQQTGREKN